MNAKYKVSKRCAACLALLLPGSFEVLALMFIVRFVARRSPRARAFLDRAKSFLGRVAFVLFAPAATALAQGEPQVTMTHEFSAGGMVRMKARDPALVGGGNGGLGTSVNFDDGNLNYGRGLTALGVQGRSIFERQTNATEARLEAVYFYDLLNARGETDFRPLPAEARERAGRDFYLNEAYVGVRGQALDGSFAVRLGNQRLKWSESRYFGYSIAPVNPISASRRYQPGNGAADAYVALPMLSASFETAAKWRVSGFYQFAFKPTEPEAAGTFLSANDYYSPGARFLQLGLGSPLVPDDDASFVTPATPFGSRVGRAGDRRPGGSDQFGVRVETPEIGERGLKLSAYAMQVHSREPIVSVHSGTIGGLLGITARDYTSSGDYFVEYVPRVPIAGVAVQLKPAAHTQLKLDYSKRFGQPLQIDDDILITAGLAPAAAVGACAPNPASPTCVGTLAALNANPLIAARGGITLANAGSFLASEIRGYERHDLSQYSVSVVQGLPPVLGARLWYVEAEAGGIYIHDYRDHFLDASVTSRPGASGERRPGFATRSAWGYRCSTKMEFANVMGMEVVAPSLAWQHDVKGNAPITLGTFLEGSKSATAAVDFRVDKSLSARVAYRSYFGKGSDADRLTDRDFVSFSVTRTF